MYDVLVLKFTESVPKCWESVLKCGESVLLEHGIQFPTSENLLSKLCGMWDSVRKLPGIGSQMWGDGFSDMGDQCSNGGIVRIGGVGGIARIVWIAGIVGIGGSSWDWWDC